MLPASGSDREYCRLQNENRSVIGAFNDDVKENTAFLSFTNHFRKKELPVPEIYTVSSDLKKYLLEDLGDTTLFDYLSKTRESEGFSENIISEYRKVLQVLPKIQIIAGKDLNYSVCYPREAFDKQSMMWDLNYFKYYFLKLAKCRSTSRSSKMIFRHSVITCFQRHLVFLCIAIFSRVT